MKTQLMNCPELSISELHIYTGGLPEVAEAASSKHFVTLIQGLDSHIVVQDNTPR